uniref:Sigma-70 family RNA polymerase sigma factor n=1 Tax=Roseihalotalea indica TaxID=2867963 RepID=A0AA49GN75_9BACT|nr:sigma-70 family RNA polymerase sigma factor [Tunicatimonas sp. TK19036]
MKLSYLNSEAFPDNQKAEVQSFLTSEPEKKTVSDAQLWSEFKQGSQTAYALLYKTYAHDLYRYGMSLYHDSSFIKDCIHDIFLEIWNRRQQLGEVHSIKPYLLKAIRNKINKEYRKRGIRRLWSSEEESFGIEISPEKVMIQQQSEVQNSEQLQRAISALSSRQREAIFLKFYQGLSYEEIASILSITIKGAYKLIGRAIHLLREKMTFLILLLCIITFL